MNQSKRKTRPGIAVPERAIEPETNNHEGPNSPFQCTTPRGGGQTGISALLLHGAENAVPRKYLRQLTGLSDRDLRRRIQEEQLSGVPILSDNMSGYFLPADNQERQRFIRSMRSRAAEIEAVAAAVEETELHE